MSNDREFYAATVEEAVEKASGALGVPGDQLHFEVLDQGSTGFLGIGARDARIVVENTVMQADVASPPSEEDRPLEHEGERGGEPQVEEEPRDAVEHAQVGEEDDKITAEEAPEDLILAVDEFATALVDAMGIDATIDAHDAGDAIAVDVATKETGLFIGQKGETIDAIQYLLNVAVYKNRPFAKRIVVDSEGYRQRRIEAIQGMAHRTARRAVRERRPLSLPPMPAAERRVVHLYLKENPKVTTSSEGKDDARKVVVNPIH
ncbi:MAG: Jag N-terminal domain-containing protein [Actinomycetota bacterium]|nr:Jag N-terminal domain-containing protein [Actinomycetota bacterium]